MKKPKYKKFLCIKNIANFKSQNYYKGRIIEDLNPPSPNRMLNMCAVILPKPKNYIYFTDKTKFNDCFIDVQEIQKQKLELRKQKLQKINESI